MNNIVLSEDLVQDIFIARLNKHVKFKDKSNGKAWIFSILINKIVDYYRKKNKSLEVNQSTLQNNKFENNIRKLLFG